MLPGAVDSYSADADVPVTVHQRRHQPQRRGAESPEQVTPQQGAAVARLCPAPLRGTVTVTSSTAAALHTVTAAAPALCPHTAPAHVTLAQLQQLCVHQAEHEEQDGHREQQVQPAV